MDSNYTANNNRVFGYGMWFFDYEVCNLHKLPVYTVIVTDKDCVYYNECYYYTSQEVVIV